MLYTTSDTFRIMAYSDLHLFRYIQASSRIFSIIKAMHEYSQTYHILIPGIFRTGGIFKINLVKL